MAINLNTTNIPSRVLKTGDGSVEVTAGKSFVIETTPDGEEILNEEVPAGKLWTISINIAIEETSA